MFRNKTNPERMYVYPEFKRLMKIQAASKGKDIIGYTKEIVETNTPMNEIVKEWDKKFKKTDRRSYFDFP